MSNNQHRSAARTSRKEMTFLYAWFENGSFFVLAACQESSRDESERQETGMGGSSDST